MPSDVFGPRRLHPISPVLGLPNHARELIPALVAVAVTGLLVLAPIGLAVFVAVRYLAWWRTTWSFDGRVFRFDGGVLGRRQQRVPAARVQQVELIRTLRHRAFGLATLRVETAGGTGGSEVELDAVDLATAEALRARLLQARDASRVGRSPGPPAGASIDAVMRAAATESESPEGRGEVLVRLSARRLALAGMTGAQLLVLAPALGWVVQVADDVPDRFRPRTPPRVPALDELAVGVIAVLVVVAVAIWIGLAALTSLVTSFGLTLRRRGDDLVLSRGLFERRESVVPLHRVQALRVEQSLLRRALGMASLRVQSGGSAVKADQDRVTVPLMTSAEVDRVLEVILGGVPDIASLVPAPPAARVRALKRYGLCAVVPALALAVLVGPWGLIPGAAAIAVGLVLGEDSFRSLGHCWDHRVLVTRTGSLVRRTVVVPATRAQSTRVAATVFQRRRNLATLAIDVAGRGGAPRVVDQHSAVTEALAAAVLSRKTEMA